MLHDSGEVLYSAAHTLRRGRVYLLGLNPGGSHSRAAITVAQRLKTLPRKTDNFYLDSSWQQRASGTAPVQRRVQFLLDELDLNPENVAASNLIFKRSRDASGVTIRDAERCWPVHAIILGIVKPRAIIVFGTGRMPYGFVAERVGAIEERGCAAGHGAWRCRTSVTKSGLRVFGLPHFSRYDITTHHAVADWIRRRMAVDRS